MTRRALLGTKARIFAIALVLALTAVTTMVWNARDAQPGTAEGPMTPVVQKGNAPSALWIGDSYTAGHGAQGPAKGYACLVSSRFRWDCHLDAQGGTGFVNDGSGADKFYGPLAARLARTNRAFDPDLVVIDAGRNDFRASPRRFRAAAVSYLHRARSAFPDAKMVLVLPFLLGDTNIKLGHIKRILRRAAHSVGATVINTTTPVWRRAVEHLATVDGLHPTAASHAAIARLLERSFIRLGVPRAVRKPGPARRQTGGIPVGQDNTEDRRNGAPRRSADHGKRLRDDTPRQDSGGGLYAPKSGSTFRSPPTPAPPRTDPPGIDRIRRPAEA